ncbi:MAG TPA: tRNA (adenosine(37)-N6)-dimethylallyltransferase MiaA, partial [Rhodothermales bacterium]
MLRDPRLGRIRMKLRIPVIAGPTAVGKTDLSLQLAEDLGCEIVSADSRQIYRELSIGTAKPSEAERARVRHHFVHERSLDEPFSAGRFADEAVERMNEILSRDRLPLVVGGSTLYLQALLHGLADIPEVPAEVRRETMDLLARRGAESLYAELQEVDPVAAATMDPTKTQRLVRAMEVYRATGTPLSEFHRNQSERPFEYRTIVLNRDRKDLYRRIDARVDRMLENG